MKKHRGKRQSVTMEAEGPETMEAAAPHTDHEDAGLGRADADDQAAGAVQEGHAEGGLREVERERDDYRDRLLRTTAEFDNFRKRTDRERQTLSEAAAAGIIEELLPLVDDLERALTVDSGVEGTEAYRKGVELIHRQLTEILRKRGVQPIEALGATFDPNYHQAVSYEPAADRSEGEIIEEFRRGYLLGGRLLRPAMVKVAKG